MPSTAAVWRWGSAGLDGHGAPACLGRRGARRQQIGQGVAVQVLQESIQGGVEVYVGLNKFDAVDDVPDQEIKAAIRSAIAEWEKKYTPGI